VLSVSVSHHKLSSSRSVPQYYRSDFLAVLTINMGGVRVRFWTNNQVRGPGGPGGPLLC
jgi:hypothetical protein